MFFTNLLRTTKFALQNFQRNAWLSIVTIIILCLALLLVSLLAGIQVVANESIKAVESKIEVSIFFTPNTSGEQVAEIAGQLEQREDVRRITTITADQALTEFKDTFKDNPALTEAIETLGDNPLGPVLVIQARSLSDYASILAFFDAETVKPLVQEKNRDFESTQTVVDQLAAITNQLKRAGLILASIFALIAVLVVYNTMRITIYSHREEIGIMKLVGAGNAFVRAPFIIESVIYAVIAAAVTFAIFYPSVALAAPFVDRFFSGYDFSLLAYLKSHIFDLILLQFGSAVALSMVSSSIAVGRYLRV